MRPTSGGLLNGMVRRNTPLPRRAVAYFCSGAHKPLIKCLLATSATKIKHRTVIFRRMFGGIDTYSHSTDRIFGLLPLHGRRCLSRPADCVGTVQVDDLGKDAYRDLFRRSCSDVHSSWGLHMA